MKATVGWRVRSAATLLGLLPAVTVTGLITLLAGQRQISAPLEVQTPPSRCPTPLVFTPTYKAEATSLQPRAQGWFFQSTSWLSADVCQAGTLTLRASGQKANGQSPRLSVFLNSQSLGDFAVGPRTTLNIALPSQGRLTLAYLNDYYSQEARVAFVGRIRFTGSSCSAVRVNVPLETGGHWYEDYGFATLNTDFPLKILPCQSGRLTAALWGRVAGGHYPEIELTQGGRTLGVWKTSTQPYQVQLDIAGTPLQARLINPYGKLLADRNLDLEEWFFRPQPLSEK